MSEPPVPAPSDGDIRMERTMTHVPRTTEIRLPADMTAEALLFPTPSDEAVEAADLALIERGASYVQPLSLGRTAITSAYAIDLPRLLAEARAEGEAARTAEIEALLDALAQIAAGDVDGVGDYSECVQRFASRVLAAHFNPEAE